MKISQLKLSDLSEGERGVYLAFVIIGLFGAVLSFLVVNKLGGEAEILRTFGIYDLWAIASGAIGATTALYLGRHWLGMKGLAGWIKAAVAVPLITFGGSLVGGTLTLPVYGTMFGPLALGVTLYENAIVLFLWVWTIFVIHTLFAGYRKERETLFATRRPQTEVVRLPA